MKRTSMILALLLAAPSGGSQQPAQLTKSTTVLGDNKEQASEALKTGVLTFSEAKQEYSLVPRKPSSGGAQASVAWSLGKRALRPDESLNVDVQVGEYKGKPVFLPLAVPKDKSEQGMEDSLKLLANATSENNRLPGQPEAQSCSGAKVCVKWCKDDKGNKYCCKYECVSRLPSATLPKN